MEMNNNSLLPCPFCGGEADFIGETTSIKCKSCGGAFIVTNPFIKRFEVVQAWNTRAVSDWNNDLGEQKT